MRLNELKKSGSDLLLEHNVVNRGEIARWVEQFAKEAVHPNAKQWFQKVLARFLEKDPDVNVPMTQQNMPANPPDWLKAAIERGDDLRVFSPNDDMLPMFHHIVDFFNWMPENPEGVRIIENPQRLMAVTVPVAIQKSEQWTEHLAKQAEGLDADDVDVLSRDGAFVWVRPKTKEVLRRDGSLLQNCLGQGMYADDVMAGRAKVDILRDAKGEPHVAIRFSMFGGNRLQVEEVKGKQNKPPIGRYSSLSMRYLNSLVSGAGSLGYSTSGRADIERMGLTIDPRTWKLTSAYDDNQIVFRYADFVTYQIKNGASTSYKITTEIDGGIETVALLSLNSNRQMSLISYAGNDVRDAIVAFLNGAFDQPVYLQKDYGRSNFDHIKIFQNFTTGKWGTLLQVYETVATDGDLIIRSIGKDEKHTEWEAFDGENSLGTVNFYDGNVSGFDLERSVKALEFISKTLNSEKKLPSESYFDRMHYTLGAYLLYFDNAKGWGKLNEVGKKIWSGKEGTVYQWDRPTSTCFTLVGEKTTDFLKYTDEGGWYFYENAPLAVLKGCLLSSLKKIDWSKQTTNFDSSGLYYINGQWGGIEAAKPTQKLGNGVTIHEVEAGEGALINAIFLNGEPVFGWKGSATVRARTYQYNDGILTPAQSVQAALPGALSAPICKYLNDNKVEEFSTVDARENLARFLWGLGIVHDTRSNSWKLLQKGKKWYDGSNFEVVNFRNRSIIVNNDGQFVGHFKMSGGGSFSEEKTAPGHTKTEVLHCISELINTGDLRTAKHDDEDGYRFRKHGFGLVDGKFQSFEKIHPQQEVLKLKNGWTWFKRAFDPKHWDDEKFLNPDRYSLVNKEGDSIFRAVFEDGYLRAALERNMKEDLKAALLALMTKIDMKLTSSQSLALRVYRHNGKFKPLAGHKQLAGYLAGRIDFGDGHYFKRPYDGAKEWGLYKEDPTDHYPSAYLTVTLDDDGIDEIKFKDRSVKRRPHEYTPYLHKLMDMFALMSGED